MDACPILEVTEATKGCPDQDGDGVTDKDIINRNSFAVLDNVDAILKRYPEYNLVIEGHTDS